MLHQIFYHGWEPIFRTAIATTSTYLALIVLLRIELMQGRICRARSGVSRRCLQLERACGLVHVAMVGSATRSSRIP